MITINNDRKDYSAVKMLIFWEKKKKGSMRCISKSDGLLVFVSKKLILLL